MFRGIKQMLDSLQFQYKFFLFIFSAIFFISASYALELGISPPILNFEGKSGNEICREFRIFSDREGLSLRLDDKWANKNSFSRDIKDYNYNGEKFGIETEYYGRVILDKEYLGEICIKAKNKGPYYGLLEVNSENGNVGLGSWMAVNISGDSNKIAFNKITGRAVSVENDLGNGFLVLIGVNILLVVVLCVLILKSRVDGYYGRV